MQQDSGYESQASRVLPAIFDGVTFVIGSEATNVINVGLTLTRGGVTLAESGVFFAYISDASTGLGKSGATPSAGVAVGSNGFIVDDGPVVDRSWVLQTTVAGLIDLDFGEAAIDTWHLVVVLPSGKIVVSNAITFA